MQLSSPDTLMMSRRFSEDSSHIASLKLLEDVQLPGVKTPQKLQIASHFATLESALHESETELVREVEETCARNSMTLAVQHETLANAVASMSSGIEQA